MFTNTLRRVTQIKKILRLRFCHQQTVEKTKIKVSSDVAKYLDKFPEYAAMRDNIPKYLLRIYKTPESMYLINKNTAAEIVKAIKTYLNPEAPIVEINPGFGFLTEKLIDLNIENHIYMYENSQHFGDFIGRLQNEYPDRIKYKRADFSGMWKLAFQDKMDNGNRMKELLGDLSTSDVDRIVNIIGAMPGPSFLRHLMYTIIFHNTTNQIGRPNLFITMPIHHYEFLTDDEVSVKHKLMPALFQLLFDYRVLTKVPKLHYLPWIAPAETKRNTLMDEHYLYLVNVTQKARLPCPAEYLPLMWHFFRPINITRTTRVIPMLEQWIPGCGVWLISGQDPPDSNKELLPTEEDAKLPHINIFTEFGDLTMQQKLTVFKKFISWPEFEQCPFRAAMESHLPKTISAIDSDDKTLRLGLGTHVDDETDTEQDLPA